MLAELDSKGIYYKMLFDGFDFMQTEVGSILIPDELKSQIKQFTYSPVYEKVEEFLDYCEEGDYIGEYSNKYRVKLYKTSQANDIDNPWHNKPYILFNPKLLKNIDLEFYVCPSYDEHGKVDGIGYRIKHPEEVNKAFKWIFMEGNNIIYGKDTIDKEKECYVVEGFRDYVALKESGYNVIGLGSVFISPIQEEYLKTIKPIILLDNDKFGLQQGLAYRDKYRIATLQTNEKDAWDTFSKGQKIKILDIV